jgi:hypothetical protein
MSRQARLDSLGTLPHVIVGGINKRRIVDDEGSITRLRRPGVGRRSLVGSDRTWKSGFC